MRAQIAGWEAQVTRAQPTGERKGAVLLISRALSATKIFQKRRDRGNQAGGEKVNSLVGKEVDGEIGTWQKNGLSRKSGVIDKD